MKRKLIKLAARSNNARHCGALEALRNATDFCKKNNGRGKAIILLLDDVGSWNVKTFYAGLGMPQTLALLEWVKAECINEMGK